MSSSAQLFTSDRMDDARKVVRAAANAAKEFTQTVISKNQQAEHIIKIVEAFLEESGRILYGGAAINALLPTEDQFYDPRTELPDYDMLTPDPLGDCAALVQKFRDAGYTEVEARLGLHEGTYKVFVDYRCAADITEIPEELYSKLHTKAKRKSGLYFAPPDWLRMASYLELSRPAGDVSRWEKVYTRLLLLNRAHPMNIAACRDADEKEGLTRFPPVKRRHLHALILESIQETRALFAGAMVEGIYHSLENPNERSENLIGSSLVKFDPRFIILAEKPEEMVSFLTNKLAAAYPNVKVDVHSVASLGEMLPARQEVRFGGRRIAIVMPTQACHAYVTLSIHIPWSNTYSVRVASIDLAITLLYACWYAGLQNSVGRRILCVIQSLLDIEARLRLSAPEKAKIPLFPLTCLGHQPAMPELKKAHRERVVTKKVEMRAFLEKTLHRLMSKTRKRGSKAAAKAEAASIVRD